MSKLNLAIKPLVDKLATFFVCGKNSTYKPEDYACRLTQSAIHNQSLNAMSTLTGTLSADRVLDKVYTLSYSEIQKLITKCNRKLKLPNKVTLAIDFIDKVYYGNKNYLEVMGTKGGKYARIYIEVSTVNPGLFINSFAVNQFTNNKDKLLKQLIDGFHKDFHSKIQLLLIDRGFFSKAAVKLLYDSEIKIPEGARINDLYDKYF